MVFWVLIYLASFTLGYRGANPVKFQNASITTIDNGITSCSTGVSRPYIQNYDENLIGFDFNRLKPVNTIIHMYGRFG